jgi:hypothetical protein
VQDGDPFVLIAIATGIITDIILNAAMVTVTMAAAVSPITAIRV